MPDFSVPLAETCLSDIQETATFSKSNWQQSAGLCFAKKRARANFNYSLAPTERDLFGWFV